MKGFVRVKNMVILLSVGVLLISLIPMVALKNVSAASGPEYPATIEYKETLTRIVHEDDVRNWAPESRLTFGEITASADGSKAAFFVGSDYPSMGQHLYLMNGDGSGLTDITAYLPAEVDTVGTLQLNDDGSRLFFVGSPGDTTGTDIYYYDIVAGTCIPAVLDLSTVNNAKIYDINNNGTRLFFRHSEGFGGPHGLYYADVGGAPVQAMDIGVPPCNDKCQSAVWYNNLYFLGNSTNGEKVMFSWNPTSVTGDEAMWYVRLGGSPAKVPNEGHRYIWDTGWNMPRFVSADGTTSLYVCKDSGEPERIFAVDLTTGAITYLGQGDNLGFVTLSPNGTFARFSGMSANRVQTLVNLKTGQMRDTLSELMRLSGIMNLTHITSDDRYYFKIAKPEKGIGKWEYNRIHRIDMAPTDFSVTPNISTISFSAPALLHDGTATITVYATVSDAQGLGTIEWVKMHTLADGLEKPDWRSENSDWGNSEPLHYDNWLYDDGTHGDELAGDGIFTNNTLKSRSDSGFYDKYNLPHDMGIRVIAKDVDDNHCIADTSLSITDEPVSSGISISLLAVDFPAIVHIGSSSSAQSLTITNPGATEITIGTLSVTGPDTGAFSLQNDNCSGQTLGSSESCTVDVIFSPTSAGKNSAALSVPTVDLGGQVLDVPLNATGSTVTVTEPVDVPSPAPTIAPITPAEPSETMLIAETRTVSPGDKVQVPVRLEGAENVGSMNFTLTYDPNVIKVSKVDKGSLLSGIMFAPNYDEPPDIYFGFATTEGVNGSGSIAYIEFEAIGSEGSSSPLSLSEVLTKDTSGEKNSPSIRNGLVSVRQKTLSGDYNGDGRITELDALAALRMSVHLLEEDLILDMDSDNSVTADDARIILELAVSGSVSSAEQILEEGKPPPDELESGELQTFDIDGDGSEDRYVYTFNRIEVAEGLFLDKTLECEETETGFAGTIILEFENPEGETIDYSHYEIISKPFAETVNELEFSRPPDEVVKADPCLKWDIKGGDNEQIEIKSRGASIFDWGRMHPDNFKGATKEQILQWCLDQIGPYMDRIKQAAERYDIPPRLLATVILNELGDYNIIDQLQEVISNNGSVGMAQINVHTAINHNLVDVAEEDVQEYLAESYYSDMEVRGRDRAIEHLVWERLNQTQIAIEAAAREVNLVLNRINENLDKPWQKYFLTGPIDRSDPYANVGQFPYHASERGKSADEIRISKEQAMADMVCAAYNTGTIIWSDNPGDPSNVAVVGTLEKWLSDPKIPYPNSRSHGLNGTVFAEVLAEARLFEEEEEREREEVSSADQYVSEDGVRPLVSGTYPGPALAGDWFKCTVEAGTIIRVETESYSMYPEVEYPGNSLVLWLYYGPDRDEDNPQRGCYRRATYDQESKVSSLEYDVFSSGDWYLWVRGQMLSGEYTLNVTITELGT